MSFWVCLSSFGVLLRFCMSRRRDSSWSLLVVALSEGCSFSVVVALLVVALSGLSLASSRICMVGRRVGVGRVAVSSQCVW